MELKEIIENSTSVKYVPDAIEVIFKNGSIEKIIPSMISELMIEKNYDEEYLPIIKLSLNLKIDIYTKILNERDTVKFRLRIKKNLYDKDDKYKNFEILCNEVFCTFIDDEAPLYDKKLLEQRRKIEGDKTPTEFKDVYTFYLFKEKDITRSNTIINDVVSGTVTDIVAFIFQTSSFNNILMSRADSNSNHDSILFPALNTVKAIEFVQQELGLYRKGLLLFFDLNNVYCIDKNCKCTAWKPNEYKQTMIHVISSNAQANIKSGNYKDTKKKLTYTFTNTSSISMKNSSIVNNQIDGNKLVLIDASKNTVNTVDSGLQSIGGSNARFGVIKHENAFSVSSEEMRIIESNMTISLSFTDIDVDIMTPNKEFVIKFDELEVNKKYGGTYRLSQMITTFKKEGVEFISMTLCKFKRQDK